MSEFIWGTAGILGLDPRPFTFWQLRDMRNGYEIEQWDRLAFSIANAAMFAGAKDVDMDRFHKFNMHKQKSMSVDKLRSFKSIIKKE